MIRTRQTPRPSALKLQPLPTPRALGERSTQERAPLRELPVGLPLRPSKLAGRAKPRSPCERIASPDLEVLSAPTAAPLNLRRAPLVGASDLYDAARGAGAPFSDAAECSRDAAQLHAHDATQRVESKAVGGPWGESTGGEASDLAEAAGDLLVKRRAILAAAAEARRDANERVAR